jgi:hypothetical protein
MRPVVHARRGLVLVALVSVLAVLPGCGDPDRQTPTVAAAQAGQVHGQAANDSVVIQWNNAMIEAQRRHGLPPTAQARALAIMHTCAYDAWAAYDVKAVGTRLGSSLRRPATEHTLANEQKAISFAAYRAAVDLYPNDKAGLFDPLMAKLGYDPKDTSTDKATPSGVGNVACQAVLDFRHGDGSNQLANTPGGTPGEAYSDYTGFKPVNDPMDMSKPFDPATVKDAAHWQPLTYTDENGKVVTPTFLSPHWGKVVGFALTSAAQFRSATGPAKPGTDPFKTQAQALLDASANLTEAQKVSCGWWAAGPDKELPPGYWSLFGQYVARRDAHGADASGIEKDVKLFFILTNATFDASIAGWGTKRDVDYVRPITALRSLFRGQKVQAWGGPGKGTQTINGEDWLPYHPATFPTPPFAEYVSGHSVFGGAGAESLKLFTGSDNFGDSVTIKPGSTYAFDPGVPSSDVTLSWTTFTQAADEAGISRIYCGMHFAQGDVDGKDMGRKAAAQVFGKAQTLFNGTAAPSPTAPDTLPRTL